MEILPTIVFSGGYQKPITCRQGVNLMVPKISVESTMRYHQCMWQVLEISHRETRSVSEEGNSAGKQGCKTTWLRKHLNCCVAWKAFGKEWNGKAPLRDGLVLSLKFYNCKTKENRLCKSLHYDGNTCKRRSVFWKLVIGKSFWSASSHLNFTSPLLPEMHEVSFLNRRWIKRSKKLIFLDAFHW